MPKVPKQQSDIPAVEIDPDDALIEDPKDDAFESEKPDPGDTAQRAKDDGSSGPGGKRKKRKNRTR